MVKYFDDVEGMYSQYLDDESSIAEGTYANRIWFPTSHQEVVEIINQANSEDEVITISGGGTGISGGRAPPGGWILATDKMLNVSGDNIELWTDPETGIEYGVEFTNNNKGHFIRVPVGMTLKAIQNCVRRQGLFYPPDPTERSSFIGGNVSTNASGARSFKYGATRSWVEELLVVLSSGESTVLNRDMSNAQTTASKLGFSTSSQSYIIPLPDLKLPDVTKHVAGPVLDHDSQPIDLFIGTNGILGVVTEVKLRLLPAPINIISMFAYCNTIEKALSLVTRCQQHRENDLYPTPMSVEFLDDKAINVMQQKDNRIQDAAAVIMLEQDIYSEDEEDSALSAWNEILEELNIDEVSVALSHQENEHHKFLRHWVPEWLIKTTKEYGFPIFVSDTSVPEDKFKEFMIYLFSLADRFRQEKGPLNDLSAVLLGHVGDSHPHLAFIPTNKSQALLAEKLLNKLLDKTIELGGSIASEHGLGKKIFNGKPAIVKQYGEEGIRAVRNLKDILDPNYRLCPGNLVPIQK